MSNLQDVRNTTIPITLDKTRNMRFDLNAFAELEEKFGSMQAAFDALQGGSMKAVRTLLWAGLVHEDERLTEQKVGSLVTLDKVKDIVELVTQAITSALPEAGLPEAGEPGNA